MLSFELAVLCLVTCQPFASQRACSSEAAVNDNLLPETRRELDQVRAATAKFHDLSAAVFERYIDIDVFVSGQGFHFLKNSFLLCGSTCAKDRACTTSASLFQIAARQDRDLALSRPQAMKNRSVCDVFGPDTTIG